MQVIDSKTEMIQVRETVKDSCRQTCQQVPVQEKNSQLRQALKHVRVCDLRDSFAVQRQYSFLRDDEDAIATGHLTLSAGVRELMDEDKEEARQEVAWAEV
eukprot:756304-Hanusia_phi.AAC.2